MPALSHPRRWRRVGRGLQVLAVAAVVTGAIALTGGNRPALRLTADAIDLGQGVSVTPAPGWTVGDQGPGWVTLHNAFSTAEMEIKVKPASGNDPVAVLQGDISRLSSLSTTGLTNVRDVGAPSGNPLQSANFQQQASVTFNADGTSRMGLIPVVGSFSELLNTSTHQSAFIVFAQNSDASAGADSDGQSMIDSLL
ncbi:hypothetical protein A5725_24395 [Mycobacterium kubicae]|uniref:hypothetical protein n=1 Tax=Mycobacterium kubicae TaxID=120959 RepID=UPI0007FF0939|nr:hypothetical protein [Mycobacterium kubicae]OBF17170.1 hypothetical protein A5725_24395 [Mycobacterium kubicae]